MGILLVGQIILQDILLYFYRLIKTYKISIHQVDKVGIPPSCFIIFVFNYLFYYVLPNMLSQHSTEYK